MKRLYTGICAGLLMASAIPAVLGGAATPGAAPNGSDIQTQLRLNIKDDTKEVHLISANNDPYIHTKTYVLKHADPYELRPFLREAVGAERVSGGTSKIECIKYNDGTGILIVSAEEYRFKKQEGLMSIDEVVAALDQPKIVSEEDFKTFIYFPKYWDATSLRTLVSNVGANVANDSAELTSGEDAFAADPGLNAILFYVAPYSKKNIEKMLELYDTPTAEVDVKYSVYEIDVENDAKIGADFQAWKNGEGSRLLSLGGRVRDGWGSAYSDGVSKMNYGDVRFVNMSPKWNTRYLDFLLAKGNAKVMTSGNMTIMNRQTGTISKTQNIMHFSDGHNIANQTILGYSSYLANTFVTSDTAGADGTYRILAYDSNNTQIDFSGGFTGDLVLARTTNGSVTSYVLYILNSDDGTVFMKDGKNLGKSVKCFDLTLQLRTSGAWADATITWGDTLTVSRDVERDIIGVASTSGITNNNGYGFSMTLVPTVCEKSTAMTVDMRNDSLVGFDDNGTPRISRNSRVHTSVMINNDGKTFVIGGLEKKAVVKSVSKVPILGDIPLLGWIFSSESTSTKKSQLVLVMNCTPVAPETSVESGDMGDIIKVKAGTADAGEKISYGFDQYLIDPEKKGFDPLP